MMYCRWLAALLLSSPVSAQLAPRLSASIAIGPSTTHGGEFVSADGYVSELSGTIRLAAVNEVAVLGTATVGGIGTTGDILDICIPSTRGGCKAARASLSGFSIRLGAERAMGRYLSLGASLGAGWYGNTSSSAGGARIYPLDLAAIVPVVSHVALLVRGTRLEFRDFGGDHFHANALLFGVRVY